jgi:hypothetical protein
MMTMASKRYIILLSFLIMLFCSFLGYFNFAAAYSADFGVNIENPLEGQTCLSCTYVTVSTFCNVHEEVTWASVTIISASFKFDLDGKQACQSSGNGRFTFPLSNLTSGQHRLTVNAQIYYTIETVNGFPPHVNRTYETKTAMANSATVDFIVNLEPSLQPTKDPTQQPPLTYQPTISSDMFTRSSVIVAGVIVVIIISSAAAFLILRRSRRS